MAQITVKDGETFPVRDGERLVLALEDHGIDVLHRCGGHAKCTTCRVVFLAGEPTRMTEAEQERLTARGLLGQVRLSCQIVCEGEMRIDAISRVSTSELEDAGPRPDPEITPVPVWRPYQPPAISANGEGKPLP
jgi:ferredoxin